MAIHATKTVMPRQFCRDAGKLDREDIVMGAFTRVTQNPAVMGGKPCIRGMRVTVGMIVTQIGAGQTIDRLLAGYPYLEREDILEALRYATEPSSPDLPR
jgi:uncharacterized protein (DUF433 family)